ncbi:MAG: hypothetical protein ABI808_16185 [Pseudonocardiales bacterium]
MPDLIDANFFVLAGPNISVTLSPSLDGSLQVSYIDAQTQMLFQKDQVQSEDNALGTVVTVVLSRTPDLGSTTFSLLVPTVRVRSGEPMMITTLGITSIHRTSLAPGFDLGQRDGYTEVQLQGTASFVES